VLSQITASSVSHKATEIQKNYVQCNVITEPRTTQLKVNKNYLARFEKIAENNKKLKLCVKNMLHAAPVKKHTENNPSFRINVSFIR
jgi:hypothetical protein